MSKLSVSLVNSIDEQTDLILTTANTLSGNVRIFSSNDTILFSGNTIFSKSIGVSESFAQANTARDKANNALANTTGTFAGDLTITGNVGIGTAATSRKLYIAGNDPIVTIADTDGASRRATLNFATSGGNWSIEQNNDLTIKNGDAGDTITLGSFAIFERLNTGSLRVGTSAIERMRIDPSGNVLIGRTTSTIGNGVILDANGSINTASIFVTNNVAFDTLNAVRITEPLANTLALITNANTAVTVDPSGNVLVGRTTSTVGNSVKLDVNGAINASSLLINGAAPTYGATVTTDTVNATRYIVFVDATSGTMTRANVDSGLTFNPSSNTLNINGSINAVTKSFVIRHPSKPDMKLRYGSLEGPENGVYVRGVTTNDIIELPDYWPSLVDENSITVNLTGINSKAPSVKYVKDNKVYLNKPLFGKINCYYTVFAERKDVDKLIVEF